MNSQISNGQSEIDTLVAEYRNRVQRVQNFLGVVQRHNEPAPAGTRISLTDAEEAHMRKLLMTACIAAMQAMLHPRFEHRYRIGGVAIKECLFVMPDGDEPIPLPLVERLSEQPPLVMNTWGFRRYLA